MSCASVTVLLLSSASKAAHLYFCLTWLAVGDRGGFITGLGKKKKNIQYFAKVLGGCEEML